MLDKSGDLIPVRPEAVNIPWTKRKAQVLNFLQRGPVTFQTRVYDTNVGDISPLCAYFNPRRWTVLDLNERFGIQPQNVEPNDCDQSRREDGGGDDERDVVVDGKTGNKIRSLVPRLLIYPAKAECRTPSPLLNIPSRLSTSADTSPEGHGSNSGSEAFASSSTTSSNRGSIDTMQFRPLTNPRNSEGFSESSKPATARDRYENRPSPPQLRDSFALADSKMWMVLPQTTSQLTLEPFFPPNSPLEFVALEGESGDAATHESHVRRSSGRRRSHPNDLLDDGLEAIKRIRQQPAADANPLSNALLHLDDEESDIWSPSAQDLLPLSMKSAFSFGNQDKVSPLMRSSSDHRDYLGSVVSQDTLDFFIKSATKADRADAKLNRRHGANKIYLNETLV